MHSFLREIEMSEGFGSGCPAFLLMYSSMALPCSLSFLLPMPSPHL
jgi:hypothetical protein